MLNLIVETDLGRDPDDLFAITWLLAQKVNIPLLCITPGDPDQIAFANWLMERCEHQCVIKPSKSGRTNKSLLGIHNKFAPDLTKYYRAAETGPDAAEYYKWTLDHDPSAQIFVCGPAQATGAFLRANEGYKVSTLLMQGGFCSYAHYKPAITLEKFEGKSEVPTFNFNGDKKAIQAILKAKIANLSFVGKNVCHSVTYHHPQHEQLLAGTANTPAGKQFRAFAELLVKTHSHPKAFHDPVAAAMLLFPELGTWITAQPYYTAGGWGSTPVESGPKVLVDLARPAFWEKILTHL